MDRRPFSPGFRLSLVDIAVVVVAVVSATLLDDWHPLFFVGILVAVGHFFLFCNVFRLPRWLELMWVVAYIAWAVCLASDIERLCLPASVLLAVFSVAVILWGMRLPSYHGLDWQFVNPGLRGWWESHQPMADDDFE